MTEERFSRKSHKKACFPGQFDARLILQGNLCVLFLNQADGSFERHDFEVFLLFLL
jgi:hypothetical protein